MLQRVHSCSKITGMREAPTKIRDSAHDHSYDTWCIGMICQRRSPRKQQYYHKGSTVGANKQNQMAHCPPVTWKVHSRRSSASKWCCASALAASRSLASLCRRSCRGSRGSTGPPGRPSSPVHVPVAAIMFGRNVHSFVSASS